MAAPLRNTRWERFCLALAQGRTADESYEIAGYKPNRGNAARLNATECIRERVTALQQAVAAESISAATLTNDWIIDQLIANVKQAREAGRESAANTALMLLGNTRRLFVTVSESTVNRGDAASMSLEGLNDRINQLEAGRDQGIAGGGSVPPEVQERPDELRRRH